MKAPPRPVADGGWRPLAATGVPALLLLAFALGMAPRLGAVFALLACAFYLIGALLGSAASPREERRRRLFAAAVFAAVAATAFTAGHALQTLSTQRGDTVVAALDAYHLAHGGFPEQLPDLVPAQIDVLPRPAPRLFGENRFLYRREARGYLLCFAPEALLAVCYSPQERRWRSRD
jgi:hypothetical protein